jgi:DNA-binding NarL/FixJ family response regulator
MELQSDERNPVAIRVGLSARELEVLELAALGLTDKQIGARLYISSRTVAVHLDHIASKCSIPHPRRRTGIIAYAYKNGLVK